MESTTSRLLQSKYNDAPFYAATMRGGWGSAVNGSNGEFLEAGAWNLSRVLGTLLAETLSK
jgi:hypothetical protein